VNDIIYDIVISTAQGGVALIIQAAWIIRDLTLGDPTDSILDLTLARGPGLAPQLVR